MARIRLHDPVITPGTDNLTTIAELAAQGLIKFREVPNFQGKGQPRYFADYRPACDEERRRFAGWEISAVAYRSRMQPTAEAMLGSLKAIIGHVDRSAVPLPGDGGPITVSVKLPLAVLDQARHLVAAALAQPIDC